MRLLQSFRGGTSDFLSSIRFRLTLWFVIILGVVLTVFSLFIYTTQSRDLRTDAAQAMQAKLARLEEYFRSPAWQDSSLSPAQVPDENGRALLQPADFILLATTDGRIAQNWGARPSNADELTRGLLAAAQRNQGSAVYQQTIAVTDTSNQLQTSPYLLIAAPVRRRDALLGVMILGSPSSLDQQLQRLRVSLLVGSIAMLVIAFAGGLWLADRAMQPVRSITHAARAISESDLSRRLNLKGRDELAQLGGTFDSMLSRLEKAFERQRQFVADASHELRTPLTIINLEVGRALSGSNRRQAEYQHALEIVNLESTRMTRLVNDLLTLARMDSGQTVVKLEDLDLSDVTVEAYERMLPLADHQGVKLDIGDLQELPVRGDRQYLVQMISNLIENAIKYSQAGGHVRLETEPLEAVAARLAVVRVSDSGPGIPPDDLPRVFERFYRVDPARSREAQEDSSSPTGTGLGLSIVAWIVRAHHGDIKVSSELGSGTTFAVSLPLLHG
jgi:heavy metal sensor kinase